jgi:hypothetical protein
MKFTSAVMVPDPPVLGSQAYVNISGPINEVVTNGTVVIDVALDGVQLYTNNAATCGTTTIALPLGFGTINVQALACPAASGSVQNISVGVLVPTGVPSGLYTIIFNATDQANNNLFCFNATFSE